MYQAQNLQNYLKESLEMAGERGSY
ncbi:hypothetical protein MASSI9I_51014 [Massilia sp. 9I]|nr:hypothetical protein MASSI9I_51014 [Massilia sp. 9I]